MSARTRARRPPVRHRSRAELVQQRRFVLAICLLALTVIITAAASNPSSASTTANTVAPASFFSASTTLDPRATLVSATYRAELQALASNDEEPLAVLTLEYDAGLQRLSYALEILGPLPNPDSATICQGTAGQNGGAVYTLFAGPPIAGKFSGVLCEGHLDAGALVGTLRGASLTDLILLIEQGNAYVTIGTSSQAIDATRGQIQ